jgi:hypothetical protein
MEELHEFRKLITALQEAGVRFVIIGGVAMRLQGSAHITDNLDVCYARDPENLTLLVNALGPHRVRLRGVPEDVPFRFDERTLRSSAKEILPSSKSNADGESAVGSKARRREHRG